MQESFSIAKGISPANNQTPTSVVPVQKKSTLKKIRQGAFSVADETIVVLKIIESINDPYGASKVATVVRILLETVVLARANSKQLNYISERVTAVTPILQRISGAPESKLYVNAALTLFSNVVNECTAQAKKYSQKNYVIKLVQTGANQEKFAELNTKLTDAIGALTLALGAEATVMLEKQGSKNIFTKTNDQEFKKIQEKDKQEIIKNESKIFKQVKEYLEQNQNLENTNKFNNQKQENNLSQQDRDDVLESQIQSAMATLAGKLALNPIEKKSFLKTEYQSKPPIDSRLLIPFHNIKVQQKIAQGSFGSIYQGVWCEIPVVVKKVCGQYSKQKDYEQFVREVNIMAQLRNPHITQFYGACLEPDVCIVMEYLEQGSLEKLLQQKTFTHEKQKSLAFDIAKGLLYLHTREVLHRDLKTANILINAQGQAKLTDFGLSKTADHKVKTALESSDAIQWMAPETFSVNGSYSAASDIYSYGMVLWSICTSKKPFEKLPKEEIVRRIKMGNLEKIKNDILLEFQNIIKACWSQSAEDRPELLDIIEILKTMKIEKQNSPSELCEQGRIFLQHKDLAAADRCFRLASEQGFLPAKTKLGMMCLANDKKEEAYQLLLEAAEGNDKHAQFNVGRMFEKGDGVEKNFPEALKWYKAAKKQGVPEATRKIEELEKLIDQNQI